MSQVHDPAEIARIAERARATVAELDLAAFAAVGVARKTDDYNLVVHYVPTETMGADPVDEAALASLNSPAADVAVYLHIPPCTGRCSFCHYAIVVNPEQGDVDRYLEALKTELRSKAPRWNNVGSVLIGGGTPTYLSAAELDDLLTALRDATHVPPGVEFTVESSPETLAADKLQTLLRHGFNRLNTGVQSFQGPLLRTLARRHDADGALAAVELARSEGVPNVNIDLIYALPGQSLNAWIEDLLTAAHLGTQSISTYHLRKRPETGISQFESPEENLNLLMKVCAAQALQERGYRESMPDNFCRLDQATAMAQARDKWRDMVATEGAGLSACSRRPDATGMNVDDLGEYVGRVEAGTSPFASARRLSVGDQMRQRAMFALRVLDEDGGLDHAVFSREFGSSPREAFSSRIVELEQAGLVSDDGRALRLTWAGTLFADEVCERFYPDDLLAEIRDRMSVRDVEKKAPLRTA